MGRLWRNLRVIDVYGWAEPKENPRQPNDNFWPAHDVTTTDAGFFAPGDGGAFGIFNYYLYRVGLGASTNRTIIPPRFAPYGPGLTATPSSSCVPSAPFAHVCNFIMLNTEYVLCIGWSPRGHHQHTPCWPTPTYTAAAAAAGPVLC